MDRLARSESFAMDTFDIVATGIKASRIGIGARAIGGRVWGAEVCQSIDAAPDHGINLIDTAPALDSVGPRRLPAKRRPTGMCGRGTSAGKVIFDRWSLEFVAE
jgi:hypothetical protein